MKVTRHTIAAALTAVCALAALTACDSDPHPSTQGAAVMCEKFIKQDTRIKSPGSLKFSDSTDTSETTIKTLHGSKPWKYEVRGWIDSQNDMGTLKRNRYSCTVSTKDADTWNLADLTFLTHN